MTLTEFLLARIAEDEAVARGATPGAWHADELYATVTADPYASARAAYDHGEGEDCWVIPESMDSGVGDHNLAHIAKHSPARVLAECKAKRRAIEEAWEDHCSIEGEWGEGRSEEQLEADNDQPRVVRWLAGVYADHPDYREEWRVS